MGARLRGVLLLGSRKNEVHQDAHERGGGHARKRVVADGNRDSRGLHTDAEDDDEVVVIPKEKYDMMVEDLLTMAELIDMVSDMRTKDVRAIQEFGKLFPAYAEYEKNRLSLYRDAAKEAEDIMNRWDEELDDDYEPEELYSD